MPVAELLELIPETPKIMSFQRNTYQSPKLPVLARFPQFFMPDPAIFNNILQRDYVNFDAYHFKLTCLIV